MTTMKLPVHYLRTASVAYAAPLLLTVIALFQIYRAQVYNQSPWKGGGFGMFASNDSPDAYLIRTYLVTERGESRVKVPSRFAKTQLLARTVPTPENLHRLAVGLANETWVRMEYQRRFNTLGRLDPAADSADQAANDDAGQDSAILYRALRNREPQPSARDRVRTQGVRLELWKMCYDHERSVVSLTKRCGETYLTKTSAPGSEARTLAAVR
jgi:hypothetical protein